MRLLPEHLIATGQPVVPLETITRLVGLPSRTVHSGLQRLRQGGRLFSPARGLYVAVPPEYRSRGVVPAEWFVDPVMRYLRRSYYVGLLTAAAMHGAGHQAPQVFQVMLDTQLANRDLGPVRLRFHVNSLLSKGVELPVDLQTTHTGTLRLASRELTAVDLVAHPTHSGGLSNVATVLAELEDLDAARLAGICRHHPRVVARRLGWLLEGFGGDTDVQPLRAVAAPGEGELLPLDHHGARAGKAAPSWGLIINTEIERDV